MSRSPRRKKYTQGCSCWHCSPRDRVAKHRDRLCEQAWREALDEGLAEVVGSIARALEHTR